MSSAGRKDDGERNINIGEWSWFQLQQSFFIYFVCKLITRNSRTITSLLCSMVIYGAAKDHTFHFWRSSWCRLHTSWLNKTVSIQSSHRERDSISDKTSVTEKGSLMLMWKQSRAIWAKLLKVFSILRAFPLKCILTIIKALTLTRIDSLRKRMKSSSKWKRLLVRLLPIETR
jgi:hypothetical protein